MPTGAVRVEGLKSLQTSLKAMDKQAPRELRKALKKAMEPVELVASSRTPVDSGTLRKSNRVSARGTKVMLVNKQPYANAIHWGRKWWPNKASPKRVPSYVKATPWLYDTLQQQDGVIARTTMREIERFLDRTLS